MRVISKRIFGNFLLVLLALAVGRPAQGQGTPGVRAGGGGRGNYVLVQATRPAGEWAGAAAPSWRLERRTADNPKYVQITKLAAPATAADFATRVARYNRRLLLPIAELQGPLLQRLARTWEKSHQFDSLRIYGKLLPVRQALGLAYIDTAAARNTTYLYRLTEKRGPAEPVPSALVSWPGRAAVGRLRQLKADAGEHQIVARWRADSGPLRPTYVQVRRQDDLRGEWKPLPVPISLTPYQNVPALQAYDGTIQRMRAYRYTLRTLDEYENPGPPADTVQAAAYNFLNAGVVTSFEAHDLSATAETGIRLSWRFPDPNQLRSVRVYRSKLLSKDFQLLAEVNPGLPGYTDATAAPMQKYYYYIQPTGLLREPGTASATVFGLYDDRRAPLAPHGVQAQALEGGVRLRWQAGDVRLKGYYVYRGSGDHGPLRLLGSLHPHVGGPEQTWTDSSKTLLPRQQYRYALRAESSSHQLSAYSDTALVTTAAAPAAMTRALPPVTGLQAHWEGKLPSVHWNEARLGLELRYAVRRGTLPDAALEPLPVGGRMPGSRLRLPLNHAAFRDSSARLGLGYLYEVMPFVLSGATGAPTIVQLAALPPAEVAPPALTAAATPKGVELRWGQGSSAKCRLYRHEPGAKPQVVATVTAPATTFRDAGAQPKKTYYYFATALDAQQRESSHSEEIGVRTR